MLIFINHIFKMIDYYRIPQKQNNIAQHERLKLLDDSEIKDAIYNKTIEKVKVLSLKNSNVKDDSFNLFKIISVPLCVIELDLSSNFSFITDITIEILCSINIMPELRLLNIADNMITDESLAIMSKCYSLTKLEELVLFGNSDITSQGLIILAESKSIRHIKKLDLHATSVDDEGVSYLFKVQNSSSLQTLNLSMNWQRITNKSLYSYGLSKYCTKLKNLYLQDCLISDIGIEEISESQNSVTLETLNLNNSIKQKNNNITDKSLSSIAFSRYLTNLKTLELRNTDITAKGIKTLSVSLASENLTMLRLSHCQKINEECLLYIQKIIGYDSLKKLYLNDCKIAKEDFEAFEMKNQQVNLIY